MADLFFPGVANPVTPVNDRQADVLRRLGWGDLGAPAPEPADADDAADDEPDADEPLSAEPSDADAPADPSIDTLPPPPADPQES